MDKIILDNLEHFPSRFLTDEERRLLIAKIIRYTSTDLAKTMPPEVMLEVKIADSNLIERFFENCSEEDLKQLFINIGAEIRIHLTKNPDLLGLESKNQRIVH